MKRGFAYVNDKKIYKTYQEGLIKSLIADPDDLSEVVRLVNEDDFGDDNYKLVYSAMLQLERIQEPISLPGIVKQIITDAPDAHVDPNWILSLDNDLTKWTIKAPTTTWAKLLKQESSRIRVKNIVRDAYSEADEDDPLNLIQNVKDDLEKVALDNVVDDNTRDQDLDNYIEHVNSRLDENNRVIPSLYPSVDKYTIGWLPGQMITVGARTSVGKTIFAGNCAVAAAAAGKSVLMFSLEMGKDELLDRLVSSISMVDLATLRNKKLEGADAENFNSAIETLRNYKIDIDETANVTVDYIRSKATKKARSEEGLDMIIVDYLQLINNPNRRNGSRQESVAEISREMKILAKQLGVPIMVLVQLNRENKDDPPDALPKLSDIRESGAIAQDSDIVILLHRKLDDDSVDPKAAFIIAKNRNGAVGKIIWVRAKMQYATFEDKHDDNAEHDPASELPTDLPDDEASGNIFLDDNLQQGGELPDESGFDMPDTAGFNEGDF